VEVESPLKAQELLAQVEAQIDIDDITIGEMPVREIEVCSVHNEQP
jgi:hypothetical protein